MYGRGIVGVEAGAAKAGAIRVVSERDNKGRFVAGNTAGVGCGRPKGLAERCRAATREGAEIVEYYLEVARDKAMKTELRLDAYAWLADRGWGKPVQAMDIEAQSVLRIIVEDGSGGDSNG